MTNIPDILAYKMDITAICFLFFNTGTPPLQLKTIKMFSVMNLERLKVWEF